LLENSIKYGFQKKPRIHIRVRGWLGEDALYFTVEDNGGGVDETMLEQLRDILRSDEVNIEHNGLQNINRRIWLGYGGDSGLTIDSTEGEGFTVKLKLRLGGM
jgi:two-component system sensor histidine kinase YesM